ncbi:MAG TPA: CHASE2 domain-containing protein, partial [Desulfatiglandales bacterium]|nr:CHASE2 domain-containing protein [Desulfatiglandales bacterium]
MSTKIYWLVLTLRQVQARSKHWLRRGSGSTPSVNCALVRQSAARKIEGGEAQGSRGVDFKPLFHLSLLFCGPFCAALLLSDGNPRKKGWKAGYEKTLKRFFSLNPVSLTILLTLLVLVLFVVQVDLFEIVELKTYDFRFLSRGTKSPRPDVVMAVLDEKSLKSEGRWPWPRSKMAKLIEALSRDGAKVIGFDIIFAEPDENSSIHIIRQIEQKMKHFRLENE